MDDDDSFDRNSFNSIEIERNGGQHSLDPNGFDPPNGFDLTQIQVRSDYIYPLQLDIQSEVQNILASGVFKNIENPILYEKLCDTMMNERYINLLEVLFWTIFVVKFQKDDSDLLENLRKRLGGLYSDYFSRLMKPKEELSNMGIFAGAYVCHIMFFNLFPKKRMLFDMRFILDCYHIIIHEVNGIFVSDLYIQSTIEKLFGAKFFHFEKRVEKKKRVEKHDLKNEPLLRGLNYDLKNLPMVPGGLDLAHELSNKFRKAHKKFKSIPSKTELSESMNLKSNTSEIEKILKLTQPTEERKTLSISTDAGTLFPKLRFNCHQISPTVSTFLDNSNNSLPFQKKKVIRYTGHGGVIEVDQMSYRSPQEIDAESKAAEKSEKKKKNVLRGKIADYEIGNRGDDYAMGYLSKELKSKFQAELDMKYILDNVKPKLRGSHSVRGFFEEAPKNIFAPIKSHRMLSPAALPCEVIKEEKAETQENKPEIARLGSNMEMKETPVKKEEAREVLLQRNKSMVQTQEDVSSEALPTIRTKLKESLTKEIGSLSTRLSPKKGFVFFPKVDEAMEIQKQKTVESMNQMDFKKSIIPDRLKYKHAQNKKLGKGRQFVDLSEQLEEVDPEHQRRFAKKCLYDDKRKKYVDEHDPLIRKDVDANIDNLVHALLVKKNAFNKNFGKVVKTGKPR